MRTTERTTDETKEESGFAERVNLKREKEGRRGGI